jgi:Protein kinase domain
MSTTSSLENSPAAMQFSPMSALPSGTMSPISWIVPPLSQPGSPTATSDDGLRTPEDLYRIVPVWSRVSWHSPPPHSPSMTSTAVRLQNGTVPALDYVLDDSGEPITLGEGRSGVVYAVSDVSETGGKRLLAMKEVVPGHSAESTEAKQLRASQLIAEVGVLLAANHPGLVSLQHLLQRRTPEDEIIVGMAMQRALGSVQDLLQAIQPGSGHKMSELSASVYAWRVGEALRYCHEELGIVHRDLSARNVLVRLEDGWPMVGSAILLS